MNSVQASSGNAPAKRRRPRSRTVRAASLLLLLQAAVFVAISVYLLLSMDLSTGAYSVQQIDTLTLSIILALAAFLAALSAIGFLFRLRASWLLAMAIQAMTLISCLGLYFDTKPQAIFPAMLCCVVMAFFLNSSGVRVAFHGAAVTREY